MLTERLVPARDQYKVALSLTSDEHAPFAYAKGEFFIEMRDEATGEVLDRRYVPNLITYDASILGAMLLSGGRSGSPGLIMLAVGDGATGSSNNPDAPDKRFRRLNNEISRKGFSTVQYVDANGDPSEIPTNICDFTVIFTGSEAVGSLNEMALMCTVSDNPLVQNLNPDVYPTYNTTRDLRLYDILFNYATFGVLNKPVGAVIAWTWRVTC